MRYHLRLLTIIFALLTMVVTIPLAQDSPTVTITPTSGAVGTGIFEIVVGGLSPDETYTIELVLDGVVVFATDEVANADGIASFSAASTDDDEPGTYTVQVVSNDSIIAAADFELVAESDNGSDNSENESDNGTPVETVGSINITPDTGPVSTLHTINISDLEPDAEYTVEITASKTEEVVYRRIWTSTNSGTITIEIFAEEDDVTGTQVVSVFDSNSNLVAQDDFFIEDAPERNLTVDIDPLVAPAGRTFTINIDGLVSFDSVTLQVISEANRVVDTIQTRASNQGVAIASIMTTDDFADGTYTVDIYVDGEQLAEASFTIGDAETADTDTEATTDTDTSDTTEDDTMSTSDVSFVVEPEAGPVGSVHTMTVSGLEPNQAITLTILNDAGDIEYATTKVADENGSYSINISSSEGDETGTYPVRISNATSGQVLASAQMIITEGDAIESTGDDTTAQTGSPSISVSPQSGDIGATHVISLSGMPPEQRIGIVVRSQTDGTLAVSGVVTTDANGTGTYEFTSREMNAPGVYDITAIEGAGEIASATLTIEGAIITIEPQSGVLGSTHVVTVTGLNADETITVDVSFEGEVVYTTDRTADASGTATLNLVTDEDDSPGDYTVSVVRESGNQPSAVLTATTEESAPETTDTTPETTSSADTQVIEGTLQGDVESITFSGEEGQYVIISVESDEFDTAVSIYDRDEFEIGYNDDSRGSINSQVGPIRLPYTGEYRMDVFASIYADPLVESASFVATIETMTVSSVAVNEPVSFSISPENPAVYYELSLEAGSSLDIIVDSNGTLDTVVQVLYPDGFELAFDDDGGMGFDAELNNVVITTDGTYIVMVSSFIDNSTGEGTITISQDPVKSLDEMDEITISLNDKVVSDLVVFEAEAGDLVTLNLEKLSGEVEDLYVYATVDGMEIMYYSTMGVPDNLPLVFVMPMSGEVVVTFEEFGFGDGITFNVTLTKE